MRPDRIRLAIAAVLVAMAVPSQAMASFERSADATLTVMAPETIRATFDSSSSEAFSATADFPSITGNATVDQRIRELASQRGYVPRPETNQALSTVDGFRLHTDAAFEWQQLRSAAAADGITITLTSGFRTIASQRAIFNRRLTGTSDEAIDSVLATTAPPGFSRHHTGRAIDLRSGPFALHAFANSPAYEWLSANNWANSKAHGWLPSYPEGVEQFGPDPEPWEFVWVGTTNIICADYQPSGDAPFCDDEHSDHSGLAWLYNHGQVTGCSAIRYCPQRSLTRGEAATMLWRLHGRQQPEGLQSFLDVAPESTVDLATRWLSERRVVHGTSPTTFDPSGLLSRGRFVVMLWRLAGRPSAPTAYPFTDAPQDRFVEVAAAWAHELGLVHGVGDGQFDPFRAITRAEAALIIYRYLALVPTLT